MGEGGGGGLWCRLRQSGLATCLDAYWGGGGPGGCGACDGEVMASLGLDPVKLPLALATSRDRIRCVHADSLNCIPIITIALFPSQVHCA
jgi:hypothetical protein